MADRTRNPRSARDRRWRGWLLAVVGAVIAVSALFGAAVFTDRSEFCVTCHEMTPYYEAWEQGNHYGEAECVECHVDGGIANRLAHKFVALGEVVAHFQGDTDFPRPEPAEVPERRCMSCHDEFEEESDSAFSHADHVERAECVQCHSSVGHEVTRDALEAAGILDPDAWDARYATVPLTDVVAAPGQGIANIEGHAAVLCSECHDMQRTGCPACHETPQTASHEQARDCLECHTASAAWAFSHPTSEQCEECHEAPDSEAHQVDLACSACHPTSVSWQFEHPTSGECSACHTAPAEEDHPDRNDCATCHSVSGGWEHDR